MLLKKLIYSHLINYPLSKNLNTNYSLGFILGTLFTFQIISGLALVMFYTPHSSLAFNSINYIMKDIHNGWLIRYFHMNGASFIFILLYWHIGKGLFYSTYLWQSRYVWWSGYVIFLITVATSFLGYILPWGQMSFWGVTVITQLLSIVPFIGPRLVLFLWGDFQVGTITLQRIFVLHYLLPFLILGLIIIHIFTMHNVSVNSPNKWNSKYLLKEYKNINLYPYYIIKDLLILSLVWSFILWIICFYPERLANPVNYIEANPSKTPKHIIPEWYFLILYSILKTIPNKVVGIIIMLFVLLFPIFGPLWSSINLKNYISYFDSLFIFFFFVFLDWIYFNSIFISLFNNVFYYLYTIYIIIFFIFLSYLYIIIFSSTYIYYNKVNQLISILNPLFSKNCYVIDWSKINSTKLLKWYNLYILHSITNFKINFFIFVAFFAFLIDMGYWPASGFLYQYGPYIILYFILSFDFLFEPKK